MSTNVVPFGRYKGQPVEAMSADEGYVRWLTQQPWFAERYQNLYNVVMHINTDVPQDSPVHNAIQMQLSRPEFGAPLAFIVEGEDSTGCLREIYRGPEGLTDFESEPEFHGWDLRIYAKYSSLPDEESGGFFYSSASVLVEIKPELGDDYPSVLRQMIGQSERLLRVHRTNYTEGMIRQYGKHILESSSYYPPTDGTLPRRALYVQRYHGTGASLEDVKNLFKAKGYSLITEEELEWYATIDIPPLG